MPDISPRSGNHKRAGPRRRDTGDPPSPGAWPGNIAVPGVMAIAVNAAASARAIG